MDLSQAQQGPHATVLLSDMGGRVRVVGLPVRLSETPGRIKGPAPELGEHTNDVLRELGYSWEDIAGLAAQEVI